MGDDKRIVTGSDGAMYMVGDESPPIHGDDDYVGGGIRFGPAKQIEVDGKLTDVREIVTLASGGGFSSSVPEAIRKPPANRGERLKVGHELWKKDALGGAIVNLTCFFTFGRGLVIQATGVAKELLQKFWAKNDLKKQAKTFCAEGVAFGEVFLKLVVHKEDVPSPRNPNRMLWRTGQVEVVPIAPELVFAIDHNPANVMDINEYIIRFLVKDGDKETVIEEKWPPINKFDPAVHEAAIAHLKFNAASNDLFGTSELVRVVEWIDNYSEFLRDGVIINKLYRSPCYDITIKEADEGEIRRAVRRYEDWEIGMNPVHNDREEWKILEFSGANVSQKESRRAILLMAAAGVNLPEFMLADGSNANLASAKAQQLPAVKKFEDRQEEFRDFWNAVHRFVLDVAEVLAGVQGLEAEEDFEGEPFWAIDVKFPPISVERDEDVATANEKAIEGGYMSPQTAAARLGLDYERESLLIVEAAIETERRALKIEEFKQSEDFAALRDELGLDKEEPGEGDDLDEDVPPEDGDPIDIPIDVE